MQDSYLHLVANDDHYQSETNHAFNILLYNNLVIARSTTDMYIIQQNPLMYGYTGR